MPVKKEWQKKSKALYIRVTENVFIKVEKAAEEAGMPVTEFLRALIAKHVNKEGVL